MDVLDLLFQGWGSMNPPEQAIVVIIVLGMVFFAFNEGYKFLGTCEGIIKTLKRKILVFFSKEENTQKRNESNQTKVTEIQKEQERMLDFELREAYYSNSNMFNKPQEFQRPSISFQDVAADGSQWRMKGPLNSIDEMQKARKKIHGEDRDKTETDSTNKKGTVELKNMAKAIDIELERLHKSNLDWYNLYKNEKDSLGEDPDYPNYINMTPMREIYNKDGVYFIFIRDISKFNHDLSSKIYTELISKLHHPPDYQK